MSVLLAAQHARSGDDSIIHAGVFDRERSGDGQVVHRSIENYLLADGLAAAVGVIKQDPLNISCEGVEHVLSHFNDCGRCEVVDRAAHIYVVVADRSSSAYSRIFEIHITRSVFHEARAGRKKHLQQSLSGILVFEISVQRHVRHFGVDLICNYAAVGVRIRDDVYGRRTEDVSDEGPCRDTSVDPALMDGSLHETDRRHALDGVTRRLELLNGLEVEFASDGTAFGEDYLVSVVVCGEVCAGSLYFKRKGVRRHSLRHR